MTASTRGVLQSTVTVFSNERSVKITGLVKQAQYDVTVTVCTDTCCQETKPVTLSKTYSRLHATQLVVCKIGY